MEVIQIAVVDDCQANHLDEGCFNIKNGARLPINVWGGRAPLKTYQSYMFKRMRGVR